MAIQIRNRINPNFSTASMSDLVFLLLIFFMLTSTLVSPNAVKLLLPESHSKTIAKQSLTVYINDKLEYYIGNSQVSALSLVPILDQQLSGQKEASVVLRADKTVPLQFVVTVIDAVNTVNEKNQSRHKVILATSPIK